MTNIIIMKKFKILCKLSECYTETHTEQTLLETWPRLTCLTQGYLRPSICRNHNYLWSSVKQHAIKQGIPEIIKK